MQPISQALVSLKLFESESTHNRVSAQLKIGSQKIVPNNSFDFLSDYYYRLGTSKWVLSLRQKSRIFANDILKNSQYSAM